MIKCPHCGTFIRATGKKICARKACGEYFIPHRKSQIYCDAYCQTENASEIKKAKRDEKRSRVQNSL